LENGLATRWRCRNYDGRWWEAGRGTRAGRKNEQCAAATMGARFILIFATKFFANMKIDSNASRDNKNVLYGIKRSHIPNRHFHGTATSHYSSQLYGNQDHCGNSGVARCGTTSPSRKSPKVTNGFHAYLRRSFEVRNPYSAQFTPLLYV
jgi:hypothetical protein